MNRESILFGSCLVVVVLIVGAVATASPKAEMPAVPQQLPPLGIYARVEYVRARDSDTIEVRVKGSAYVFALRLIGTWSPETDSKNTELRRIAAEGKAFTDHRCRGGDYLTIHVPFPEGDQPLKGLTFDRIPAYVFVGDEGISLNEQIVRAGFASSTKGGALGK